MQTALSYDRRRTASEPDDEIIDIQELQVADYIVFLFALDTYMGWLQETQGQIPSGDATLRQGITLLRNAERQNLEAIQTFIKSNLVSKASISVLEAAIRPPPTPAGASVRALKLRTVLSKGGTATTKAVFGTSTKARREVQEAIAASMIDDPDAALNKFAALVLRNKRLEKWIDLASEVVVTGAVISPVQEATRGATDASAQCIGCPAGSVTASLGSAACASLAAYPCEKAVSTIATLASSSAGLLYYASSWLAGASCQAPALNNQTTTAVSWCAGTNTVNSEYLVLDAGAQTTVLAILTRGRPTANQWVTSYKVQLSNDTVAWTTPGTYDNHGVFIPVATFSANTNAVSTVTQTLGGAYVARYVKLIVTGYQGAIAMSAGLVMAHWPHPLH